MTQGDGMNQEDAALAESPVGLWASVAERAVIEYADGLLAVKDSNRTHAGVLNKLFENEGGLTRDELRVELTGYIDPGTVDPAADDLVRRGWAEEADGGRLRITADGTKARTELLDILIGSREHIHRGISDEEYVAMIKVLRRFIINCGGEHLLP